LEERAEEAKQKDWIKGSSKGNIWREKNIKQKKIMERPN